MIDETTIASLATPLGQGAIALIRMSGADSMRILAGCTPQGIAEIIRPRFAKLTHILAADGSRIDQVLVTWFKSPASYTGEDTVEIACHGGMFVARKILERLFACGAHPAEPGEFSKRAFLNGCIDLTQAEAVMDIISASSDYALRAAQEQLEGEIGKQVAAMCEKLTHVLAHIEAYIDFPDEDISPDTSNQLLDRLNEIKAVISALLNTSDQGRIFREGIRTVIIGRPNAGKSSLLNLLLGYERAIVSDIEGTTRDTVEENIHMGGFALRLIDTAGMRESDDSIEQAGIARTNKAISNADLIITVADASQEKSLVDGLHPADRSTRRILLLNKSDQGIHPSWEGSGGIRFSCKENYGRAELEQAIISSFSQNIHITEGVSLASINDRHQTALKQALESLELAADSLAKSNSPEFTALELREALDSLGSITGKVDTEDVLGAIFSTFCIGK